MKKSFLFTVALFAVVIVSFSQTGLIVKSGSKGLFVEHKVAAKENFYSIGREFNVHPRRLAAFNGLDMGKGLSLGRLINVPLSDTNFVHKAAPGIPVYYQSSVKQPLGAISTISKTPTANLRQFNHLTTNDVAANKKVIIGYLVSETPSSVVTASNDATDTKTIVEEKKEVVAAPPAKHTAPNVSETVKIDPVKEQPREVVKEQPAVEQPARQVTQSSNQGDGYFKASFVQQVRTYPLSKEETVTSGIFKTTSGWSDAKYYALMDAVEPGTIIKVINPNNNKEVYAKVLGQMSGLRQSQGLNLRISNAAASALEVTEMDKFIVKVNY